MCRSGTPPLWDVPSGDPRGRLGAVEDSFVALEFDASGDVATASIEGTVQFWDVADAAPRGPSAAGHDSIIAELTVHPGGDIMACGGADGKALRVPCESGTQTPRLGPTCSARSCRPTRPRMIRGRFSRNANSQPPATAPGCSSRFADEG